MYVVARIIVYILCDCIQASGGRMEKTTGKYTKKPHIIWKVIFLRPFQNKIQQVIEKAEYA